MYKDRLTILADTLETVVPRKQFFMSFWGNKHGCEFAGCAGGWATQIPEFQKLGLEINWRTYNINYGEYRGYEALDKFFGLSSSMCTYIFDPDTYLIKNRTPQGVAQRIRSIISES